MTSDIFGWILIHSHKQYPPHGDYTTPQDELDDLKDEPELLWQWKLSRPINKGGPYALLFAWEGVIFGEGIGKVIHKVEDKLKYNFSFKLTSYKKMKPVALADLGIRPFRSLVKLNPEILSEYHKLAG